MEGKVATITIDYKDWVELESWRKDVKSELIASGLANKGFYLKFCIDTNKIVSRIEGRA